MGNIAPTDTTYIKLSHISENTYIFTLEIILSIYLLCHNSYPVGNIAPTDTTYIKLSHISENTYIFTLEMIQSIYIYSEDECFSPLHIFIR